MKTTAGNIALLLAATLLLGCLQANPTPYHEYYTNLESQCQSNPCCLASVATMRQNDYSLPQDGLCPPGYAINTLKCPNSLAWCGETELVSAVLGKPVQLRIGQKAVFGKESLEVKFLEVSEDSRCPSNASIQCVWQGQATAVLGTGTATDTQKVNLTKNAGAPAMATTQALGYQLELVNIEPYPQDTHAIPNANYRASIIVSKAK